MQCEPFWGLARSQRKHAASDADWNQCLSEMTSIGIAPDAMTQIPELTRQVRLLCVCVGGWGGRCFQGDFTSVCHENE